MMKKLQFYKYTVWALLLLNISIIAFFVLTKPNPGPGAKGPKFSTSVVDIFNLDANQKEQFLKTANDHGMLMRNIRNDQKDLLLQYFSTLVSLEDSAKNQIILEEYQQLENEKIISTYKHFEEIKFILNKIQLAEFEHFINSAMGKILLRELPNESHGPKGMQRPNGQQRPNGIRGPNSEKRPNGIQRPNVEHRPNGVQGPKSSNEQK